MDAASKHVVIVLEALAKTERQLQSFGYRLYLDTRARSWTQPRGITLSDGDMPGLLLGFAIWRDSSGERSIIFSISIGFSSTHWSVRSFVDDEDGERDQITRELWESPEFKATTLEELVESLEQSLHALTSSVDQQAVREYLAIIERRP